MNVFQLFLNENMLLFHIFFDKNFTETQGFWRVRKGGYIMYIYIWKMFSNAMIYEVSCNFSVSVGFVTVRCSI